MLSKRAAEESEIRQYIIERVQDLRQYQALRPNGKRIFPTYYYRALEFLLQHGRTFTEVAPLPPRTRRIPKQCFTNATRFTWKWPDYSYCEGLAVCEWGGPIDHAWCIDAAGRVAEVTWKTPGQEYFGVVFKPVYVSRLLSELSRYGVLEEAAKRLTEGRDSLADALYKPD